MAQLRGVSYGGVQSTVLLVLAATGRIGFRTFLGYGNEKCEKQPPVA